MTDVALVKPKLHPRDVLLGALGATGFLPVCDHYSGVEARMKKSLQLQADMADEFGACVFDVTLDCEDGAPAGAEVEQAQCVADLANADRAAALAKPGGARRRIGARLHPVDHEFFGSDVEIVMGQAAAALSYIMIPKVESLADVALAALSAMQHFTQDAEATQAVLDAKVAGIIARSGIRPLAMVVDHG